MQQSEDVLIKLHCVVCGKMKNEYLCYVNL